MMFARRLTTVFALHSSLLLLPSRAFLAPYQQTSFVTKAAFASSATDDRMASFKQLLVPIDWNTREDVNIILGQAHFIKTIDDLHLSIVNSCPGALFGVAFCEASMAKKVRFGGTDDEMIEIAKENALKIGAGHSFLVVLKTPVYPLHVLPGIKGLNTVVRIFAATANPISVIVAEDENGGRGIMGVIDGDSPKGGFETKEDQKERRELLEMFGYKL